MATVTIASTLNDLTKTLSDLAYNKDKEEDIRTLAWACARLADVVTLLTIQSAKEHMQTDMFELMRDGIPHG